MTESQDKTGDPQKGRAVIYAVLLSCAIWLLPIYSPHGGLLFAPVLLFASIGDGSLMALAAFIGAMVLQGVVAVAFYFLLRRRQYWKWLVVVGSLPLLWYAVNFTFLYAIPALVLIEPDWSDDVGELQRVCIAADVSLVPVNSGVSLSLEKKGIAWVRFDDGGTGVLTMPGCRVDGVGKLDAMSQLRSVNASRESVASNYDQEYFYSRPGLASPRQLRVPEGVGAWHPMLTPGGATLAWLARGPVGATGRPHLLQLRDVDAPSEVRTVALELAPRDGLTLLEAAPPLFTLARYRNEVLVVDATGSVVWGPVSPPGIYNSRWGFRRSDSLGWVAWDGYREAGRSRIVWRLKNGAGESVMPRGRSFESVAVSSGMDYVAYATEANTYFSASGRLVVMRTDDGSIVFRRRIAQFARLQLAFLGNQFLAFRDFTANKNGVAVFRIPAPSQSN